MSIFLLLNCKAWHIPTDDEIHYTKGKIYVVPANYTQRLGGTSSVGHIELYTDDGKKMYFTCNYTAFNYTQYSNCGNNKEYKDIVHGKYGEVGWYIQKPFLWIQNPHPQLVSLSVYNDGKVTYETLKNDSLKRMSLDKKSVPLFIFFNVLMWYGMFRLFSSGNKSTKSMTE